MTSVDDRPTHLDLFSGLGGFALAAQWAGYRTVAFCENDRRSQEFLSRTWGIPVEPDIKTLNGADYRGISLLTAGPPCQPASRAGNQGGDGDDRWLWGEALRVLEEAGPAECLFENPVGIEDVGLDGILSEMERIGYEVQSFRIPACAVDSPQLRERYWIIGFRAGDVANTSRDSQRGIQTPAGADRERTGENLQPRDMGDPQGGRLLQCEPEGKPLRGTGGTGPEDGIAKNSNRAAQGREQWGRYVWVPCADSKLRRAPDQSLHVVDGLHRSILAALGNSIVPALAYEILKAMRAAK